MKTALVCALLALVPFSSFRMVCVTSHDLAGGTGDDAAVRAAIAQAEECARVCTHHPAAAAQPAPAPTVKCLLVADPTCEFIASAAIAVLPSAPVLPRAGGAVAVTAFAMSAYLPPAPSPHSPPPKASA